MTGTVCCEFIRRPDDAGPGDGPLYRPYYRARLNMLEAT